MSQMVWSKVYITEENNIQYSEPTISIRKLKPKSTKQFNWTPAQTRSPKNKPEPAAINPTPQILTKRKRELELETDGENKAHFKKVTGDLEQKTNFDSENHF